jgi:D-sedoheptulose 7-phosphate isomerase
MPPNLFEAELAAHIDVARRSSAALAAPFERLLEMAVESISAGAKLLFFGNGGSAADAQHWATELTVRYRRDRKAIAAIALTTDTSALTAIGNDFGFDQIFARQIEALARPGDLAIGVSTSGKSRNVVAAFRAARTLGCRTAALTGGDGGDLPALVDLALIVPSDETARIQEIHAILGHALCAGLERLAIAGGR